VSDDGRPNVRSPGIDRLIVLGYVCALGMPPLGLLLAILSARRRANRRHAAGIIAVSILAAGIWALIISAGGLTATNGSY
jgi:hypothetical protein